jgi:hypothetical protein
MDKKVRQAGYSRKWYENNREKAIANSKVSSAAARENYRLFRLSLECFVCGEKRSACIQLHHFEGKKLESGVTLRALCTSSHKFKGELKKTIPVCANCHLLIHSGDIRLNAGECSKAGEKLSKSFWFGSIPDACASYNAVYPSGMEADC